MTHPFCSLEIDGQFEVARLLDQEIGWLCAAEQLDEVLAPGSRNN
jgi:hypothetical protein